MGRSEIRPRPSGGLNPPKHIFFFESERPEVELTTGKMCLVGKPTKRSRIRLPTVSPDGGA